MMICDDIKAPKHYGHQAAYTTSELEYNYYDAYYIAIYIL